jgi:hypothetical protein
MFLKRFKSWARSFVVLVCFENSATPSTLCVKVTDYAGLPLQDASVVIVNLATKNLYNTNTARNGAVCVSQIPEGLYSVEAGLTGFLNVRYYPARLTSLAPLELRYRLPFGEITEGGVTEDAIISGTLQQEEKALIGANICVFEIDRSSSLRCVATNDLGEYALSLPPGVYRVEVRTLVGSTHRLKVDVSKPGLYRNLITIQ